MGGFFRGSAPSLTTHCCPKISVCGDGLEGETFSRP
jgi:hypothetical protein